MESPQRAYVGLGNAAFVLAFKVEPGLLTPDPSGAIELHEGALGVNRLRLSIDPYKDKTAGGGVTGSFVGDDPAQSNGGALNPDAQNRQYLYAVARDGSLRVIQVANLPETECETNIDFASIPAPNGDTTARTAAMRAATCPPVVGPAGRRPSAIGPGLRFPAPPVDVAAVDIRPDPPDNSETSVTGTHAWVLTATGAVYLVNIDPVLRRIFWVDDTPGASAVLECETPQSSDCFLEPDPAPSTIRNRSFVGYTPALDPSTGPARLDVPPAQSSLGPRILSVWTRGTASNATAITSDYNQTYVYFPDQAAITPQAWTLTWEGNLFPSPRFTGQLSSDATSSVLRDDGIDFCRTGVQNADLVTISGCTDNSQCGLGKTCVFGNNGALGAGGLSITGLCLAPSLSMSDCVDLLSTVKRYDVTKAEQNQLVIEPHKDELVRPALNPCHPATSGGSDGGADASDGAAGPDADAGAVDAQVVGAEAGTQQEQDDCPDPNDPSTTGFQCIEHRCLYPCKVKGETAGCRVGRICVDFGDGNGKYFCADGPQIGGPNGDPNASANAQLCLGELFSYQVGVGRGFAVTGSQTGLPATGQVNPTMGVCEPIPGLDPRTQVRISMDSPLRRPLGRLARQPLRPEPLGP
jgi:hypothetical protein